MKDDTAKMRRLRWIMNQAQKPIFGWIVVLALLLLTVVSAHAQSPAPAGEVNVGLPDPSVVVPGPFPPSPLTAGDVAGNAPVVDTAALDPAALPDLVVTTTFDGMCNATFAVSNIGAGAATGWFVFNARWLYVPAWGPGPQIGLSATINGLAAGQSTTQQWLGVQVFGSTIEVVVDPGNGIGESNETNNKSEFPVPLSCQYPPPAQVCTAPPANMVAWWPLDEGSGATTADIAGGNTGNLVNGPVWLTPGQVSNALGFDGVDDYVQAVNNAPDFGTGDFSIDAWVRTNPNSVGAQTIVEKMDYTGGTRRGYRLSLSKPSPSGTHGVIQLFLADASVKRSTCNADPSQTPCTGYHTKNIPKLFDGGWHHIAVTVDRDQANGIVFYLDGNPVSIAGTTDPTIRTGSLSNSVLLRIGSSTHDLASNLRSFNGAIDEVELFDRVLEQPEIKAIFDAGTSGKCKFSHVGDLDGSSTGPVFPYWQATVTVVVHDHLHQPVASVIVDGTASILFASVPGSCTTNAAGQCDIVFGGIPAPQGAMTFTVQNITYPFLTYQSSANHDSDADSNGTYITIPRP